MYYSLIGILALITLFISNHDVLFKKRADLSLPTAAYRDFLYSVAAFYVSDILWGIFWTQLMSLALFIDTEIYFAAMALGILFLTRYEVAYMADKSRFRYYLLAAGIVFFGGVIVLMFINIVFPIMFRVEEDCSYYPAIARYFVLGFQTLMLLFTSAYAFVKARRTEYLVRKRYITIAMFGIIMVCSIAVQMYFPLLPLYSIGYMLGCGLLRTFIVDNEREEYRYNLESALIREQRQSQELKTAWKLAYTDALTGANSKLAYLQKEEELDRSISEGTAKELAVVVFDLNDLKRINDTQGHEAGDRYIIAGCGLIKEHFKNSPVFRIGGDEFIVILEGSDYADRDALLASFGEKIATNIAERSVVIAFGAEEYVPGRDRNCKTVVERADVLMYEHKMTLKKQALPSVD